MTGDTPLLRLHIHDIPMDAGWVLNGGPDVRVRYIPTLQLLGIVRNKPNPNPRFQELWPVEYFPVSVDVLRDWIADNDGRLFDLDVDPVAVRQWLENIGGYVDPNPKDPVLLDLEAYAVGVGAIASGNGPGGPG